MPTISSRPDVAQTGNEPAYTVDEIVEMITDAVLYVLPADMKELKMVLHVACRTLWNTGVIEDFFIYDSPRGGCDVGFKTQDDPHYNVIQVN